MENTPEIIADVKVSELLDRLVFISRKNVSRSDFRNILRQRYPMVDFKHSEDGYSVANSQVHMISSIYPDLKWKDDARIYLDNRKRAFKCKDKIYNQLLEIRSGVGDIKQKYLKDINGLQVLDDHQIANVAAMTLPNGFGLCVFDEQGAGKTVTMIFAFDVLVERDEIDFCLIVAPKSMIPEWPIDFHRFLGDRYKIELLTGERKEKKRILSSRSDIMVTNFETTVSMEAELTSILRRHKGRSILVVDESFYVKNLNAKRTKSIRKLREYCNRTFVLCGTPAPNSPEDLIQQFNIVDFGITFDGISADVKNIKIGNGIREAVESRGLYIRHLKADVLPDLPVKRFHRILLKMEPEQNKLYEHALGELVNDLNTTTDKVFQRNIASYLARRLTLLQICSNPISIARNYKELAIKLYALDEILDDIILKKGEKVVIWSFFTASIDGIISRYKKYNPLRYDGTISDINERRETIRKFKDDDETKLLVANPAAAGAGLNLQKARFAIYESMSNQAAHYMQSLDRIHRRGQTGNVEYIILLCQNTIEIKEYERLVKKEMLSQDILGDRVIQPITREMLLSELTNAGGL